jgi:hypothetical protein
MVVSIVPPAFQVRWQRRFAECLLIPPKQLVLIEHYECSAQEISRTRDQCADRGQKLWVITEAERDFPILLLPDEY